jgi:hypothetical protein
MRRRSLRELPGPPQGSRHPRVSRRLSGRPGGRRPAGRRRLINPGLT